MSSAARATGTASQRQRVILIGASNLTRGFGTVVDFARGIYGGPLDVVTALGHGRSYGMTSRVLARQLPGVLDCGLWRALAAVAPAPTIALVTDVGNDLLYEVPVEQVAQWVDECLARLAAVGAQTLVTRLPTDNVARISRARFEFYRRLFFPRCKLARSIVVERVHELSSRVADLAGKHGAICVEQQPQWYGLDPLHFPLRARRRVWGEILSAWGQIAAQRQDVAASALRTAYLRTLTPERRWLFGFEQRRAQPAGRLADGRAVLRTA